MTQIPSFNKTDFDVLVASGEVLEVSRSLGGAKVVALPDNKFLKLLRVNGRFSTWGIFNPAKRFARNAQKLKALGIPTLTIDSLYRVPHLGCWAVTYDGLDGKSIRHLIEQSEEGQMQGELDDQTLDKLVRFILYLHDTGIYFRGLHPGNILLTPEGKMGLIDILDCHFKRPLFNFQRTRNFSHFFRYAEAKPLKNKMMAHYFSLRTKY